MTFNSLLYACFLPATVLTYYLLPHTARLWFLLGASCLFYASWNPGYLLLIVGLTVFNYQAGLWISRLDRQGDTARWVLAGCIAVDLLVLGFFKYLLFALDSIAHALGLAGIQLDYAPPAIVLPLGISFFMFEFIHYVVDVWRGQSVVRSPLHFGVFATFFPTQVAGPIKRYEQFVPQLARPVHLDWSQIGTGLGLIVGGLFKKSALADNLATVVQLGFGQLAPDAGGLSRVDAWLVAVAFAFQIYFDFSGYTDIARGSALLLGFTVPENFRRPYLASNISEFWRRWHISLSSWLRDYLYIPLGGNRRHRDRNLLITMILGGLWHGANLTFIVWGTMHGALLVAYWRFETWRRGSPTRDWPWGRRLMGFAGWALTFVLVSTAFVFFRASSVDQALSMLGFMYGWLVNGAQVLSLHQRLAVAGIISGWLVFEVIQELLERRRATAEAVEGAVGWRPRAWPRELWAAGYVLLFVVTFLLTPSSAPRFIYFQF